MKDLFKQNWLAIIAIILLVAGSIFFLKYFKTKEQPKPHSKIVINIGAILPLTGENAIYGTYIKNAIQIAVEKRNLEDSLFNFNMIYEDDQAKAQIGTSAINKLISQDNVKVIFGSWASSSTLAIAPIAEKNNVILMAEALSPKIKSSGEYIYRIQPDATLYINSLLKYIMNKRKDIQKVAILYVNNDFGIDQAQLFNKEFNSNNNKVVFFEGFDQGTNDFKTSILKIKRMNVDAVFIPAYSEIINFLKQSKELGLDVQMLGSVPSENPDIINVAGSAAEGLIYPHHFSEKNNNTTFLEFKTEYIRRFNESPEGFASLAFDGINLLMTSMENCKNDTRCIQSYLNKIEYSGINGLIKFDSNGDPDISTIYIKQIKNNNFITIE